MNIMSDVQEIFRDVFDDNSLLLHKDMTADDVEAWDSLSHIRLVIAIEKHFGIKFALGELQVLKNVGEMLELIAEKLEEMD